MNCQRKKFLTSFHDEYDGNDKRDKKKKKDAEIPCKNYILMTLIVYLHGKNKILLFQNTFMIALLF